MTDTMKKPVSDFSRCHASGFPSDEKSVTDGKGEVNGKRNFCGMILYFGEYIIASFERNDKVKKRGKVRELEKRGRNDVEDTPENSRRPACDSGLHVFAVSGISIYVSGE